MLASTKKLQAALGREEENECRPLVHKLCPFLFGSTGLLLTDLPEAEVTRIIQEFKHEDYARAGAKATRTVTLPEGPLVGPAGNPFAHTMEHTLRANGLPTKLNKGVIELRCEHTVCFLYLKHAWHWEAQICAESVDWKHNMLFQEAVVNKTRLLAIERRIAWCCLFEDFFWWNLITLQVCTEGKPLSTKQAAILRHFDIKMATFRLKLKAMVHGKDHESAKFKVMDEEESDEDVMEGEDQEVGTFDDGLPASMMMPAAAMAQG
jgi:Insertion domain in 60S ribosomal protein L10P